MNPELFVTYFLLLIGTAHNKVTGNPSSLKIKEVLTAGEDIFDVGLQVNVIFALFYQKPSKVTKQEEIQKFIRDIKQLWTAYQC